MGDVTELKKKLSDYSESLYREGFLDDHFKKLQELQDQSNPNFVVKLIHTYFENTERLMGEIAKNLSQLSKGFKKIDDHIDQLKRSSSSVGAQRVQNACIAFQTYCDEQNIDRLESLQQLQDEFSQVKERLETMFEIEKQILAAGGSLPPPDKP